jgi:hypothetical protein
MSLTQAPRGGCIRCAVLWAVLLLLASSSAQAVGSFRSTGGGAGDVLIRFTPTTGSADIEAQVSLYGSFTVDGARCGFSVEGTAVGSATIDVASLALSAWLVIDARGETEDGKPVWLRGGLVVATSGGVLSASLDDNRGRFDFALSLPDLELRTFGEAAGAVSGDLVPSDSSYAMKASGSATLELEGDTEPREVGAAADCRVDVLDVPTWPEALAGRLSELLSSR